ncbi:MAG: HAD family phosphatase [Eubacteriales bacterium]|nr:HAD family phosphatase [Eubacteriales bacterium]
MGGSQKARNIEWGIGEKKGGKNVIEGAIFDVDGTLLDTMPTWHDCAARFLAKRGIEAEPGLGDLMFTMTPETSADYLIEHYGVDMSREAIAKGLDEEMEDCYFNFAQPKPGAMELLQDLRDAGIPMTVVTATDFYCIEAAFERLDIMKYFTDIFSCDRFHTTKADRMIFDKAKESLGSREPATWVFEDGLYAVHTAAGAGYKTVGVYDDASKADWDALQRDADLAVPDLIGFAASYGEKIKNYEE